MLTDTAPAALPVGPAGMRGDDEVLDDGALLEGDWVWLLVEGAGGAVACVVAAIELITRAVRGVFKGNCCCSCCNCSACAAGICISKVRTVAVAVAVLSARADVGVLSNSCSSPAGDRLRVILSPLLRGARVSSSSKRLLASTWMRKVPAPDSLLLTCLTTADSSRPPAGSSCSSEVLVGVRPGLLVAEVVNSTRSLHVG